MYCFKHKTRLALVVSLLASSTCQLAHAESLGEAIAFALKHNPKIEGALINQDIADERYKEERSSLYPELNASMELSRSFINSSTTRGLTVDRGEAYTWALDGSGSITQTLFDASGRSNRILAARTDKEVASKESFKTHHDVKFEAIIAYLTVMQAREVLDKARDNAQRIIGHVEDLRRVYDAGGIDELALRTSEEGLLEARKAVVNFEKELKNAEAEYVRVIGHKPEGEMNIADINLASIPEQLEEAIAIAKKRHPSLPIAIGQIASATYSADAERSTLFPTVQSALSYYKKDQDDIVGGENIEAKALIRMNWAMSTGGAEKAKIRQAVYEQEMAKAKYKEIEADIVKGVKNAYYSKENAEVTYKLVEQTVKINAELLKNYENQFKLSKANRIQIIQAENKFFASHIKLINAQYRQIASNYAVLESIGLLDEAVATAIQGNQAL